MKTLRFKLTTSFLLITLLSFIMVGVFANVILERQFEKYVIGNLDKKIGELAVLLESQYNTSSGKWDDTSIENIGMNALGEGLIIRLESDDGAVLWDAMKHNSGMCAALLQDMAENMESRNNSFNGGYVEKNYQLTEDGAVIGKVVIGYYGPFFYTDNDISFLNTLNKLLVLATIIIGIFSFFIGSYIAGTLTRPISRAIKTTEQISEGNYNGSIEEVSSTREIAELSNAINRLVNNLAVQETLRKRLSADLAHELRTPLANLQSHLEAMIDGIWEPDKERLNSCHDETVRLSRLVGDLDTLACYDGEKVQLFKEEFDVAVIIKQTAEGFEKEALRKNISLNIKADNQIISADKDKIIRVFINIISNALKYTQVGGRIEINLARGADPVQVSVKDNGIGISEKDLPYIFERFYRADKSRSRSTGGSGIGLTIAKSLVEAHGGSITVKSGLGTGSEFVIELPIT